MRGDQESSTPAYWSDGGRAGGGHRGAAGPWVRPGALCCGAGLGPERHRPRHARAAAPCRGGGGGERARPARWESAEGALERARRALGKRWRSAGGAVESAGGALGERWGSAAERADTVAGAVRAPQAVSAGPRACGSHGPARYSLAVAPAACARVRRASGLCDARASWAGKDMEAAWEQNWKGLQFFITFTAVTTIFSKFLPKEPKEIVDTRRTEKEKKAKEKEARDAMSRRPDARAHARTHAPAHARARACTHTHIRAFSQACHEAAPCARTYRFRIPGFGPRV